MVLKAKIAKFATALVKLNVFVQFMPKNTP